MARSPLFEHLAPEEVRLARSYFLPLTYPKGKVIFHQGDLGQALYLVEAGQVRLYRTHLGGQEKTLGFVGPGGVFGEMSLLDGGERSASAVAEEESRLLALHREGYLSERDWRTYLDLFQSLAPALRKPDLLLYLRASLPTLRARIAKRGRPFEREIPDRYLLGLNQLYEELMAGWDLSPVYVVEADRVDFVEREEDREALLEALRARIRP